MNADAETFVRIWQTSSGAIEAAERLKTSPAKASCRAAKYRKLGVPLKKFPRGGAGGRVNVAELTRLAKQLEDDKPKLPALAIA